VLASLTGELDQTPPRYSAVKVRGRPLYEYARAGVEVETQARRVAVRWIRLVRFAEPLVELELSVSKGTYVRGLAEEIGRELGCGAHLAALRRIRIGTTDIGDAIRLERLEALSEEERLAHVRSVDFLLQDLPRLDLPPSHAQALRHGREIEIGTDLRGPVRLYSDQHFVGLAEARADGSVAAKRLMAKANPWRALSNSAESG
jgi:tRNA pseudouridine55 synthase